MKIAFVWQGFSGRYGQWQDGLWAAMQHIGMIHTVGYFDVNQLDQIREFTPDIVLYWEAPCTIVGKDADNYKAIRDLPYKKALLFAGGPVKQEWCEGFDLFFVESEINEQEFEALGLPWKRAFGVNEAIFKPQHQPKTFNGVMQATFAAWKRHHLFAQALGPKGAVCGRKQAHEPHCYQVCEENNVLIFPELPAEAVCSLLNASHSVVNTSDVWGGGQRCTLEAMACGVPAIVMSDSPKNSEYVAESGAGLIVRPEPEAIRNAIEEVRFWSREDQIRGFEYVQSKWASRHYAAALLEGINEICSQ